MLIYVIDDNKTNLDFFSFIVRKLATDIQCECFAEPVEALSVCGVTMPDLVLIDFMMPIMDGHEFVRRFKTLPGAADIPVVMVTAATDRHIRRTALDIGVSDFLIKPVDSHEMRARLTNLLALRRGHLQLQDRNRWLADEVQKATQVIADREMELILRLTKAAECRDPETGAHVLRMAHFSELIAGKVGYDRASRELILRAAPMHDIGKVGIPDMILLKPGRLDAVEMEMMKRHASIGHSILSRSESPLVSLAAEIALHHHEKFDGSGYPYGLVGEAIPLSARIVAVADVFDALTSPRPYKPAWTVHEARLYLLENSGKHMDPMCVDAFLSCWDEVLSIRERLVDD